MSEIVDKILDQYIIDNKLDLPVLILPKPKKSYYIKSGRYD